MANYSGYNETNYGGIYPLQNPQSKGWAVKSPNVDPTENEPNGRFVNQKNEFIDFWVEDAVTNFALTGITAQSRNVRQFMPHNVVQPGITIKGRAPNYFQYNRLASFIRSSHWNAINEEELTKIRKTSTNTGSQINARMIRFVLRNGVLKNFPYNGRHVKGEHRPWVLEGYVKSIQAGGRRFNPAPEFEFEFIVCSSKNSENIGMWEDTLIAGRELMPWLDWIKRSSGGFVTVTEKNASRETSAQHKEENAEVYGPPAPHPYDPPSLVRELTENVNLLPNNE